MADATSATITPLHQPQAKKAKTQAVPKPSAGL